MRIANFAAGRRIVQEYAGLGIQPIGGEERDVDEEPRASAGVGEALSEELEEEEQDQTGQGEEETSTIAYKAIRADSSASRLAKEALSRPSE